MPEPVRTLLESGLMAVVALGLGLGANALNPNGLAISRDYFRTAGGGGPVVERASAAGAASGPESAVPAVPAVPAVTTAGPGTPSSAAPGAAGTTPSAEFTDPVEAKAAERLRAAGLAVLTHEQAAALFADPMRAAGGIVFVDARKDADYEEGHIPGAWQLDHYHVERYIADVLAAAQGALQVVVYCHGKECEDSELAALDLLAFGVPGERLHVYVGGWTDWTAAKLPVETGPRGGGDG